MPLIHLKQNLTHISFFFFFWPDHSHQLLDDNCQVLPWCGHYDFLKSWDALPALISLNKGKKMVPITTGANDSHSDNGIWWPKINWEAAALKNGSRAAQEEKEKKKLRIYFNKIHFSSSIINENQMPKTQSLDTFP